MVELLFSQKDYRPHTTDLRLRPHGNPKGLQSLHPSAHHQAHEPQL